MQVTNLASPHGRTGLGKLHSIAPQRLTRFANTGRIPSTTNTRTRMKRLCICSHLVGSFCWLVTIAAGVMTCFGAEPNTLTDSEKEAGWKLLFDGKSTEGWRGYKMDKMPPGWAAVDGALVRLKGGAGGKGAGGGDDIVTTEEFENFDFSLEWKVVHEGNSGVLYHVSEEAETAWHYAPEVQILDNSAHPTRDKRQLAGACYDLYAPTKDATHPPGEWNQMRILVNGAHVEHWMNGEKILEYELWSDDWKARVAQSKHKDRPQFGTFKKGPICLQDHTDRIEFRNIKVRPLPSSKTAARLPGVSEAMLKAIEKQEIAGAVTVVATKDSILHMDAVGFANIEKKKPMKTDTLFWIASMTKPVTAVALLMLQDEGKLNVNDPVAKYIPEFANLKTPSGKLANLTIAQVMTHVSGLGEPSWQSASKAKTLADLVPLFVTTPMQFEPGAKWSYSQSGINTGSRIVEVVSGQTFDAFLQKRIFDPLGMTSTTFYPKQKPDAELVTAYKKDSATGKLEATPPRADFGSEGKPPLGNGGLFSTAPDYTRFCQMLLGGGALDGKRYLSAHALRLLSTVQTGDIPTGFFQAADFGGPKTNYGWGIGTCVLRESHPGVAEMLSPGTFGHGGAWGTQAWIDPVRGVTYILMVQRSNFPNSDASEVRREFQKAALKAVK